MKYAIVNNNKIQDLNATPSECFHPDVAMLYDTEVTDNASVGDELIDGQWVTPAVPEPIYVEAVAPNPVYPKMSPIQFKMLFASAERIAIKAARATDEILQDAYEILEDPRLTEVDMALSSNQELIDYLVSLNLLTSDRATSIKLGILL